MYIGEDKMKYEERIIDLLEKISVQLANIILFEQNKITNRKFDIEIAQARRKIG